MNASATGKSPFCFAVSATFNAEPLEPFLRFWAQELELAADVRFAPFNQPLQTLLDPGSVFAQNPDGLNVLLVRLSDLGSASEVSQLTANAQELARAARSAGSRMAAPLLFVLCPPAQAGHEDLDLWLEQNLDETPGVSYLSWREILRLYPVESYLNPLGEKLGGIAYTDLFFAALGTAIFRHAHALTVPPYKLIALDCDQTLWSGICGEDGPTGVTLDPARRALQNFMLEQRNDGMLLAMVSKNNEPDVLETFAQNPDFPLTPRHFVTWRINWEEKPANLVGIAQELSLGTDSFIFVDDNQRECAEVEETLPEVLSLNLPADPEAIPAFLRHIWAFDHPVVTEEDRQRSTMYEQGQEFGKALRGAESLAHFFDTLQLQVNIQRLEPARLARTAQLTQRTNQFNTTTIRRTEADLRALAEQPGFSIWTVDASDRFGEYGQVGVLILEEREHRLEVETLLLSCRALGRGVEHRVLRHAGAFAVERGLAEVATLFRPTDKNTPARLFLDTLGPVESVNGDFVFRVPAAALAALEPRMATDASITPAAPNSKKAKGRRRFVEYARIARDLSKPSQVLARVRAAGSRTETFQGTDTERQLAAIWSELLEAPGIQSQDNFFDLGGHSLQAVLLLLRIKEHFGVELEIDDVYSGTATLSSIATLIEAQQLAVSDPAEYAELMAEIEQMSDEEVQALLAEHTEPPRAG